MNDLLSSAGPALLNGKPRPPGLVPSQGTVQQTTAAKAEARELFLRKQRERKQHMQLKKSRQYDFDKRSPKFLRLFRDISTDQTIDPVKLQKAIKKQFREMGDQVYDVLE